MPVHRTECPPLTAAQQRKAKRERLAKEPKFRLPVPMSPDDIVTSLNPKRQRAFPDPKRFPPPKGGTGGCGCLMTRWKDPRQGDIKLETIWQPLWDTVPVERGMKTLYFFSGERATDVRHPGETEWGRERRSRFDNGQSYPTSIGHLYWPKKHTVWELEFQLSGTADGMGLTDRYHGAVTEIIMQIGEKYHLRLPFESLYQARDDNYRAALCTPLFLPSMQNFGVRMTLAHEASTSGFVRCVLNGYQHREIP
jgi:hypothetical protein